MSDEPGVDTSRLGRLGAGIAGARLVGVGEAAHFVADFHHLRARIVAELVKDHGFTHLALEVGHDEARAIEAWMRTRHRELRDLKIAVGPLTFMLFGTFLDDLCRLLGEHAEDLAILGVDLPNSLRPTVSLDPLARLLEVIDPDSASSAHALSDMCNAVVGDSGAATAFAWMALPDAQKDTIGVETACLRARVDAMTPLYRERASALVADDARQLAEAAATTDLMLRAMADLFSGTGKQGDTSLREAFVARQLIRTLGDAPEGARIAYVAHNNHVQKTPVTFDGFLVALPAGRYLADGLGGEYVAIALTHLDETVPDMVVTGVGSLGFEIERVVIAPPGQLSIEALAASLLADGAEFGLLTAADLTGLDALPCTIRSQSAVAEASLPVAFDAVFTVRTASSDVHARPLT